MLFWHGRIAGLPISNAGCHRNSFGGTLFAAVGPKRRSPIFLGGVTAIVTWNPLLSEVAAMPNLTEVFNSSAIPGEMIDIMMVNTKTLKDNPNFGKALVGAWYEIMGRMSSDSKEGIAARTEMAKASGTDLAGFNSQLKTTYMFYKPSAGVAFTKDAKLPQTMTFVAKFLFDHGILGQGATSPDFVGVEFPGGKTVGDKSNHDTRRSFARPSSSRPPPSAAWARP